jgi:uncharacterized protein YaeQ
MAALAVSLGPPAHGALARGLGGVDEPCVILLVHGFIIVKPRQIIKAGASILRESSKRPSPAMALTATIYNFDVELADTDRHVYESLALRVARHPSESEEYLVARLIAYLLEFSPGIEFSRGVSSPDEPAIAVRDLTGAIVAWIDIGTPDAERLHKAAKLAARVAVYTHKEPTQFMKQLAGKRIHNAEALELYAIDRALVSALVARLERRVAFSLSVHERELFVSIGAEQITGRVVRLRR